MQTASNKIHGKSNDFFFIYIRTHYPIKDKRSYLYLEESFLDIGTKGIKLKSIYYKFVCRKAEFAVVVISQDIRSMEVNLFSFTDVPCTNLNLHYS